MSERPKPYIGISGIVEPRQQQYLTEAFIESGLTAAPLDRAIALGVKAVHKTQFLNIENKYGPDWYPVGAVPFAQALESTDESIRMAQVYFDPEFVGDAEYRTTFIDTIRRRGKAWLTTLQFDMLPWRTDAALLPFLEQLKDETDLNIILQAHGESMQALGPNGAARALGKYAHVLDYVLFDASHGKGVRMNPEALRPFLDAAYTNEALQSVGVGVAGGLNAQVVREALPLLVQDYPDVSWDAEGQLHPIRADGTMPIDRHRATEYLRASAAVLRGVQ